MMMPGKVNPAPNATDAFDTVVASEVEVAQSAPAIPPLNIKPITNSAPPNGARANQIGAIRPMPAGMLAMPKTAAPRRQRMVVLSI